jgi:hypothetical protein
MELLSTTTLSFNRTFSETCCLQITALYWIHSTPLPPPPHRMYKCGPEAIPYGLCGPLVGWGWSALCYEITFTFTFLMSSKQTRLQQCGRICVPATKVTQKSVNLYLIIWCAGQESLLIPVEWSNGITALSAVQWTWVVAVLLIFLNSVNNKSP